MTDKHAEPQGHDPAPSGRHRAEPPTPGARGDRADLGERTATSLVRMTTTTGQLVLDLDDDPSLRDAARAEGRTHQAVDLIDLAGPPEVLGDLVVLRWPRPGDDSWLSFMGEVFAGVRHLLAPTGQVAVLLDPTAAHAYSITWTATMLAAAAEAGLPVLQDVVCVHDLALDDDSPADAATSVTLRHRVVLILRPPGGCHAQS